MKMIDPVMQVEAISKKYKLGRRQRYKSLRESLMSAVSSPLRALFGDNGEETIWALQDISFNVQAGEVVGIIGRNGAGKSTLLKILSRITEPTTGRATVRGHVGCLLEVGTGFHPELTGRENVYLNGAILGMNRFEIQRKFDSIVEFADIEKFIDTPVKHYSSGMQMRLAFSVSAHLEPEIIIVDEVLAVGDVAFQKKCMGKMDSVAKGGRTVLFVSHNMASVQQLCTRCILLENGRIVADDRPGQVIGKYLQAFAESSEITFGLGTTRGGGGKARYTSAKLLTDKGEVTNSVRMGHRLRLTLSFEVNEKLSRPSFGVVIKTQLGHPLIRLISSETQGEMPPAGQGGIVALDVHRLDLLPGTYSMNLRIWDHLTPEDKIEDALTFEVIPWPVYPTGKIPDAGRAVLFAPCSWDVDYS